jgi:hypothetical protein
LIYMVMNKEKRKEKVFQFEQALQMVCLNIIRREEIEEKICLNLKLRPDSEKLIMNFLLRSTIKLYFRIQQSATELGLLFPRLLVVGTRKMHRSSALFGEVQQR